MFAEIIKQIKSAFLLLMLFTLVTGCLYPAIVTGIAQLLFSWQANGSLSHFESLNDVVSRIIHAPLSIKETVPDLMLDLADTINNLWNKLVFSRLPICSAL